MEFQKAGAQMTKCDLVAEQLKEKIINNEYKAGDQLPSEPQLCEMFSVSRITVREALKKLSMMGMVEIKQGKGTFVKAVDLSLFMKPLLQMVNFDEINIGVLYTAREYIEGGIAHLAAQDRTPPELERLRSILLNLRQAIQDDDIVSVWYYDDEFHMQVARASHNPILIACLQAINEINKACIKRSGKYYTRLERCYLEHHAIFSAIEQQDPEAAERAILAHTRSSRDVLLT